MKVIRYILILVFLCAVHDSWALTVGESAVADTVVAETVVQQKKPRQSRKKERMLADSLSKVSDSLALEAATVKPSKIAPADTVSKATKPEEEELGSLEKEWPKVEFKHYVGVKGGYGVGSGRFEPTRQNELHLGLYNFGLMYMFDAVSKGNKYVGAVQIELEYMQKGFTYHLYRDSEEVQSRDYAVIQIPILWQPYLPLSKNGYSRFFINAGPFINYIVDTGSQRRYNIKTGVTTQSGPYKWDPMRDNRFEYGIAAGAGFKIGIKRFAVVAEFRYNITFSDLMKGVEKYPSNVFFRSPIDQMNVSLMLVYRLTK